MVDAQKLLSDHLGITRLFCGCRWVDGGLCKLSSGPSGIPTDGKSHPDCNDRVFHSQQIAFNEVGRIAHHFRPRLEPGYVLPGQVLRLFRPFERPCDRQDGSGIYISFERVDAREIRAGLQGKDRVGFDLSTDFAVESYLHHQGDTFTKRFDANSYLYITKAIDYFDLAQGGSLTAGLSPARSSFLVISSIIGLALSPRTVPRRSLSALAANDRDVHYCEIRSGYGHDAFLIECGQLNYLIGNFLAREPWGMS